MGAITESILSCVTPRRCNTKNLRVAYLLQENLIDDFVKSEIDWLWEVRNGVHIHEVRQPEIGVYTDKMFDRAMLVAKGLIDALVDVILPEFQTKGLVKFQTSNPCIDEHKTNPSPFQW